VYKCKEGHTLNGEAGGQSTLTLGCGEDGEFPPATHCKPVTCGQPPELVDATPEATAEVRFPNNAVFFCGVGYAFNETDPADIRLEVPCRASGDFEIPTGTYTPACVQGSIEDYNEKLFATDATTESACRAQCAATAGCVAFDYAPVRWSNSCRGIGPNTPRLGIDTPRKYCEMPKANSKQCVRLSCGEPPALDSAVHSAGVRRFGDVVEYQCAEGYTVDGSSVGRTNFQIRCQENALFSEPLVFACQAITATVVGRVSDATNLAPVPGVTVELSGGGDHHDAWSKTAATNSQGRYMVTVPAGAAELRATRDGYIGYSQGASDAMRPEIFISPKMSADTLRVVLTWEERPKDADLHIYWGPARACHVYYARPTVSSCHGLGAAHEVDDMDGNGPETIRVTSLQHGCRGTASCKLYINVENYSGRPSLIAGKAIVRVYQADRELAEYQVTKDMGVVEDDRWFVAVFDGKTNQISVCRSSRCS